MGTLQLASVGLSVFAPLMGALQLLPLVPAANPFVHVVPATGLQAPLSMVAQHVPFQIA